MELNERIINALGTVRSNRKKKINESLKKRLKKEEADRSSSYGLLGGRRIVNTTQLIRKKVYILICINYMYR